ncbi:hypothetical protein GCM10023334_114220 [Nonomuraea thailandensis]
MPPPGTVTSKETVAEAPMHASSAKAAIRGKDPSTASAFAHVSNCSTIAGAQRRSRLRPAVPGGIGRLPARQPIAEGQDLVVGVPFVPPWRADPE